MIKLGLSIDDIGSDASSSSTAEDLPPLEDATTGGAAEGESRMEEVD